MTKQISLLRQRIIDDTAIRSMPPNTQKIYACDYPNIRFDFLGTQFRARKTGWVVKGREVFAHCFLPAVSLKALVRIGREIRRWGTASPQRRIPGGSR